MEITREQVLEAFNIMKKCGINSPTDWFGDKDCLEKKIREMIALYYKIADKLHEDWRMGYIQQNQDETGNYPPRWKKIKDKNFISKLDPNNLPSNIRLNEGVYEIDIAHSPFERLSPDWQYENLEAAKIVACLAIRKGSVIEGEADLSLEEVGEIIHSAWLERNSWAKEDGVLSKPYVELPAVEQEKDIKQYKIALRTYQSMKEIVDTP